MRKKISQVLLKGYVRLALQARSLLYGEGGNALSENALWIVVFVLASIAAATTLKGAVGDAFTRAATAISTTY